MKCLKNKKHPDFPDDGEGCFICKYTPTLKTRWFQFKNWLSHHWIYECKKFGRFSIVLFSTSWNQFNIGWSINLSPNRRIFTISEFLVAWWGISFQYDLHPEWDVD